MLYKSFNYKLLIPYFYSKMHQQEEYDDHQFQNIGLGHGRRKKTKNQQIYGDFYQAYEKTDDMNVRATKNLRATKMNHQKSAYSQFKAGSKIQNYAAQSQVHIPQSRPKKKIKTIQQQLLQQQVQTNQVGKFNLQSFIREYQQKTELAQIQEQDQQEYDGPFCLNQKVKEKLRFVKIGEESDQQIFDDPTDLNQMTFQQYKRLIMNGKKSKQPIAKKLTHEEQQKKKQFTQSYGKGFKMLQKMGFNLSKGLGKDQTGISKPVQAVFKTAFTTKDTQIKDEDEKQQQSKVQQQLPAEVQLFQFRSKNKNINNFLIDLKNKFESMKSKISFYERETLNFSRDLQINNSMRLQKQNQIQVFSQQIHKLSSLLNWGRQCELTKSQAKSQVVHNMYPQVVHNMYPHLSLQYKMDLLYVKNTYHKLSQLNGQILYDQFPKTIKQMKQFLDKFYLQKEKQTISTYRKGYHLNKNMIKTIDVDDQIQIIDLVAQDNTQDDTIFKVSFQDQQYIIRMIELVAENTLIKQLEIDLKQFQHLGQIKNPKIFQCLEVLRTINKKSQIIDKIWKNRLRPLLFNYYQIFQYSDQTKDSNKSVLPHFVIFPLLDIIQPSQLELHRLLAVIASALWSLKSNVLHTIINPLLQFCSVSQKSYFINFYLAPRLLYQLQQFDLSQPHICKQLMSGLKVYKEFFDQQTKKDLLDNTVIPQLVMTYRKYQKEGMQKEDLNNWIRRWDKQISKVIKHHLMDKLINDFHIYI